MSAMAYYKYRPYPVIDFPERTWPNQILNAPPIWCSVDLRDGNQSLPVPMSINEKLLFFDLLISIGFKHLEIGFPSASQVEFDFIRTLISSDKIPDDVFIQVLMPARESLIKRSFKAVKGARQVIMHFYNPTSTIQRKIVLHKSRKETLMLAVKHANLIKNLIEANVETDFLVDYSPESFTGTEPEFALEIANAIIDIIAPTPEKPLILDCPATMELTTPNQYADRIEHMHQNLNNRDSIILSVHTHNDRGTAVAASELALLAGAQRVAGTLFGNGERTGNVDILTMAFNMIKQGIHPGLDLSDMERIVTIYQTVTKMKRPSFLTYQLNNHAK